MPFYTVTVVTLGHLNSINAIDDVGDILGLSLELSWDFLGTFLGRY